VAWHNSFYFGFFLSSKLSIHSTQSQLKNQKKWAWMVFKKMLQFCFNETTNLVVLAIKFLAPIFFFFFCSSSSTSYLLSLLLDMMRIMTKRFADIPRPDTRKMIPAAEKGSSWHSIWVWFVPFLSCSPPKMPAPGIPRETVLLPRDMIASTLAAN